MGVLLGGLSALFYGVGDFLGGEGAKRVSAATVVLWAGVVSFPLIAVAAIALGGEMSRTDLLVGALAGTAGAFGLVWLFAGLGRGQAAAVAPAAAALGGVLPVVVAVLGGETPTPLAWVGISLAIPAIVLSSWVADRGDIRFGGVGYGLAAGLGFGGYTVLIDRTSALSGLLPLIPARGATMAVVVAVSLAGVWSVSPPGRAPMGIILGNGLLDVSGNVTLLLGLRSGSLAAVAVASSFYPAVTVSMARLVNSEHLRARQIVGLLLTLAALSAIALGQGT